MTAAFGVHDKIAEALQAESDVLRYLVLERPPGEDEIRFGTDRDVKIAVGSLRTDGILDRWTRGHLTGLNGHVRYSRTKFMLVDHRQRLLFR